MSSNSQKIIVAETTGTTIGFNEGVALVRNILGADFDGWGIPLNLARNVDALSYKATPEQYNRLLTDVNAINVHIHGTSTSLTVATTGTVILGDILDTISALDTLRYTCHPSQFLFSTTTNTSTFYGKGVSVRTRPWGGTTSSIQHQMLVGFIDGIAANYYFNQGNYLTWKPYYLISTSTTIVSTSTSTSRILNDLDGEWANFIDYVGEYRYYRDQFVNYSNTTTSWTSGTLHIELNTTVLQSNTIIFTANYYNDNVSTLFISPSLGLYPIYLPV
jgi:hypothetical protein